jgi:hypothetical protein
MPLTGIGETFDHILFRSGFGPKVVIQTPTVPLTQEFLHCLTAIGNWGRYRTSPKNSTAKPEVVR